MSRQEHRYLPQVQLWVQHCGQYRQGKLCLLTQRLPESMCQGRHWRLDQLPQDPLPSRFEQNHARRE